MDDEMAPIVELYPTEIQDIKILWADLQRKYGELPDSKENLVRLAKEAEDRFANELGLIIQVDLGNYVQDAHGDLVASPVILPIGRTKREEFDFSRATYETQQGFADGKPGVITESGIWREPPKKM